MTSGVRRTIGRWTYPRFFASSHQVPASAASDAGATGGDPREYLDHSEWEIALDILVELGDA